jgi:hypothetical protein
VSRSPLVLYLDTQDYINIFNEPENGPAHQTLERILAYRDRGDVAIGYSWITVIEFITRPTDEFREDRVRRGQLIKEICGRNAFPFLTDLKAGARFPNNGIWLEGQSGRMITANWWRGLMQRHYFKYLDGLKDLNRAQRRKLKTKHGMQSFFRESGCTWGKNREDFDGFPVSNEFIESGVIARFLKGQCSDAEFEERVNRWLSDPSEFSRIYYDHANKPDFKKEVMGSKIDDLAASLRSVQQLVADLEIKRQAVRRELAQSGFDQRSIKSAMKSLRPEVNDYSSVVESVEQYVGKGRAGHIAHYLQKASQKGYNFQASDLQDILQLFYVQECDLFRCDKAMANLYRDYEPFSGKLVAKFSDLPARVEERLGARGN